MSVETTVVPNARRRAKQIEALARAVARLRDEGVATGAAPDDRLDGLSPGLALADAWESVAQARAYLALRRVDTVTPGAWAHGALADANAALLACAETLARDVDASPSLADDIAEQCIAWREGVRAGRGVYFTPQPLVAWLVRAVEDALATRFATRLDAPDVAVLDPAAGTGAFLLATRAAARRTGIDLLPGAIAVGRMRERVEHGTQRIVWHHANALDSLDRIEHALAGARVPVLVGNPPYSGHSANRNVQIDAVLRGRSHGSLGHLADYFSCEGRPLGERNPKWLNDDYVKFVRLAHWAIERARRGIVALVCNHGFLDHPTFRGMRAALCASFDDIRVIDLHGNSKRSERAPDGGADENVFAIQTGVCLLVMVRGDCAGASIVRSAGRYGTRADKLAWIGAYDGASMPWTELHPRGPRFEFVPRAGDRADEFGRGLSIAEIFPVYSPGIVTGRDRLVVDVDRIALRERIAAGVADASAWRAHLRSGDRLDVDEARARLAREPSLDPFVLDCAYRPFDTRAVFVHPALVERRRDAVVRHARRPANLVLVARRQMIPSRPCNYVAVTALPIVDGMIRSDNHGSESMFPLWLTDGAPNLDASFVRQCARRWNVRFDTTGAHDADVFDAVQLFAYCAAVLHAPSYRARFAAQLHQEFPRIPIAARVETFRALAALGAAVIEHFTRLRPDARVSFRADSRRIDFVRFDGETVRVNESGGFEGVSSRAFEFNVGAYAPAHKWLADRIGRELTDADVRHYAGIVGALERLGDTMRAIDETIDAHGGWPLDRME